MFLGPNGCVIFQQLVGIKVLCLQFLLMRLYLYVLDLLQHKNLSCIFLILLLSTKSFDRKITFSSVHPGHYTFVCTDGLMDVINV